jgi:hypothetical protein
MKKFKVEIIVIIKLLLLLALLFAFALFQEHIKIFATILFVWFFVEFVNIDKMCDEK